MSQQFHHIPALLKPEELAALEKLIGKGGKYDVLIPHQNVPNLMLHEDVRKAIAKDKFRIFPIKSINDAFELATGVPLGFVDVHQKEFPKGSALALIEARLAKLRKDPAEEHKPAAETHAVKTTSRTKAAKPKAK